ncbi:phosphonate ABC transporter ATP-binding protein [Telmatospirillum sp. J64-1]|uniref:phosphonate ABC transporter ATP-binding protein n=1 Tax=Telmatospirillum sp. J64-1 TaxID=2502183 RepID=UPI00115DEDAD|nr:ATP-binding cassette domain-containing protein [Telmatospirillum sp. J64-1]
MTNNETSPFAPGHPDRAASGAPSSTAQAGPETEVGLDLAVEGLRKSFDGKKAILDGISLAVPRGQAVAIIGSNGAGKSTFLRCCMRLIEPDSGRIALLGENIDHMPRRRLRRVRSQVGFVFQRHNLVSRLSALSNVIHGAQAHHSGPCYWHQALAPKAVREQAMHCLDRVGLAHLARQRVDSLSGGQSQRVAIARALMQRPRFVIADEPVASLDPSAGEEVMEMFAELMRSDGITFVFTSHHLDHAISYADRLIGLRQGRLELDGLAKAQDIAVLREIYE